MNIREYIYYIPYIKIHIDKDNLSIERLLKNSYQFLVEILIYWESYNAIQVDSHRISI
jgi:hypothetical protein